MIYTSALTILFFLDYGFFSKEDLRWNSAALTWYDNIQPMISSTELILLRQKDKWIVKTRQKQAKLFAQVNEISNKIKSFKQIDKITDANAIRLELSKISEDLNEAVEEVTQIKYFSKNFLEKKLTFHLIIFKKISINHEEKILEFEVISDFSVIDEIYGMKEPFDKLWQTASELASLNEQWMNESISICII